MEIKSEEEEVTGLNDESAEKKVAPAVTQDNFFTKNFDDEQPDDLLHKVGEQENKIYIEDTGKEVKETNIEVSMRFN